MTHPLERLSQGLVKTRVNVPIITYTEYVQDRECDYADDLVWIHNLVDH